MGERPRPCQYRGHNTRGREDLAVNTRQSNSLLFDLLKEKYSRKSIIQQAISPFEAKDRK